MYYTYICCWCRGTAALEALPSKVWSAHARSLSLRVCVLYLFLSISFSLSLSAPHSLVLPIFFHCWPLFAWRSHRSHVPLAELSLFLRCFIFISLLSHISINNVYAPFHSISRPGTLTIQIHNKIYIYI